MSKLALLAVAAVGPVMINILGYDVPVLASLISVICVALASLIAPPPPLGRVQKILLIALLCVFVVALAISDPTRSLIVSTCWAIGIGYTGLPIIQAIQSRIFPNVAALSGGLPESDPHDIQP